MSDNNERAWTCINRWRRRGYDGQVEIFEKVMADNERLRAALRLIAEHPVEQSGQWEIGSKEMLKVARAALEGE